MREKISLPVPAARCKPARLWPLLLMSRFLACALVVMAFVAPGTPATPASEEITFRRDHITFHGTLYLSDRSEPQPAVVVLHAANGGTRDYHAYRHLITELPAAGYAVLLFDRRGEGASGGVARTATFADLAADGVAAVSYLGSRPEVDHASIGVWGVSQGGWLATLAASTSPDIAFVVAVSAPGVSPADQMDYTARYALQQSGAPPPVTDRALHVRSIVNEYYRGHVARADAQASIDSIRTEPWFSHVFLPTNGGTLPDDPAHTRWRAQMDYDPLAAVAAVRVPMLFFFAQTDAYVPVDESMTRIRRTAHGDVTISRIPETDHYMETGPPLSTGPTSRVYISQLLAWLSRHDGR